MSEDSTRSEELDKLDREVAMARGWEEWGENFVHSGARRTAWFEDGRIVIDVKDYTPSRDSAAAFNLLSLILIKETARVSIFYPSSTRVTYLARIDVGSALDFLGAGEGETIQEAICRAFIESQEARCDE